jgi:hypothetical protein
MILTLRSVSIVGRRVQEYKLGEFARNKDFQRKRLFCSTAMQQNHYSPSHWSKGRTRFRIHLLQPPSVCAKAFFLSGYHVAGNDTRAFPSLNNHIGIS